MAFGELIKRARFEQNLTLEEVAQATDLSVSYVYKLENGAQLMPKLSTITKFSEFLGISERSLLGCEGDHIEALKFTILARGMAGESVRMTPKVIKLLETLTRMTAEDEMDLEM